MNPKQPVLIYVSTFRQKEVLLCMFFAKHLEKYS